MKTNNTTSTIDILLVLWRECDALNKLYHILQQQDYVHYRVLVALNDPNQYVEDNIPQDDKWYYFRGKNEGYAGGLERLWRHTESDWILCSNTDLTFSSTTLSQFAFAAAQAAKDIGYIGPKILFEDGRLQCAAGLLLGPEGLCKPRGIGEQNTTSYDDLDRVPVLSGCCFLIRKNVLEEVGGLDPAFFMYVEDVHLFLKAVWLGWMGQYVPEIEIIHEHGGSSERYGSLHLFHLERNHWWVSPQLPLSMVLLKPFYMLYRWLLLVFSNKGPSKNSMPKSSVFIAICAFVQGILGMPRQYMSGHVKKISRQKFFDIFEGHRISMKDFMSK